MDQTKILIVDDFEEDQEKLISLIQSAGGEFTFETVKTGDEAVSAFETRGHDCVIVDYRLAHENGLEILERLKAVDPFCAAIMISGQGSEQIATNAMKSGAVDYLVKGSISGLSVRTTIQRTIKRCKEFRKANTKQMEQRQFLNTLVHDIRAPFIHIRNSTSMLVEDLRTGSFDDIDTLVDVQTAALNHAEALIKTLQAYALLDDEVGFATVDLNDVFDLLGKILRSGSKSAHVKLRFDTFPDVEGHSPQISQLFQNLITNAIKFNEAASPEIRVGLADETDNTVTVCVEDNGVGIAPTDHKAIFQPLKRLWSKDEYAGTGLGLSICQKIVGRHGGEIWCESVPGKGSKFFVKLRRARKN
ncbi:MULTISPECIES: hybrid sensor histidine kinase/response regulator [unclassified Roseovarius]|uniref:ATP-binding response regulator n=1 Tax=unclassified Roseovarius TaxID=2614913 RepID=UPI00273F8099|nr:MULTISPECIES: hybrid sensor histidine kinase/response regulator [unclassified Roseovarius]